MFPIHGLESLFARIDSGELVGVSQYAALRRSKFLVRMFPTGTEENAELEKPIIRPVVHKDKTVTFAHWDEPAREWVTVRKQDFIFQSDFDALPPDERRRLENQGIPVSP